MTTAEARAENIRMIRDSAAAVVPPGGDLRRIRALRFTDPGFDRAVWREMAELGWIGLLVAENDGGAGLGLGLGEFCALAEELGTGLVPEPLIAAAVIAPLLPPDERAALIAGERTILPAWCERAGTLEVGGTVLRAQRVSGRKLFVHMADGADAFLVAAGDALALVPRDAPGVSLAVERTQDGGNFATLSLADAPCVPVAGGIAAALDHAALATAAYLLGLMRRAFAVTLDYLRTRKQFGRVIGSFQALQHRAADLEIEIALTRASVAAAAATLDIGADTARRQAAVSQAKARAADAAMRITRQAIQLHGGIGYTDEYEIGLYLRKAMVLANLYGSAAFHRARFAATAPHEDEEDG